MQYLLLIYAEPPAVEPTHEQFTAMMAEYGAYSDWLKGKGQLIGGDALYPVSDATTVAVVDGRRIVTDGPFAETKEHLGGYYLIDAPDLDAAIEAAARVPGARFGKVEIRPVLAM